MRPYGYSPYRNSSYGYSSYRVWPYYGAALGFGGFGLYYDPFWSGYGYGGYGGYPYGGYGYGGYGYGYPYQNYLYSDGSGPAYGASDAAPSSASSADPVSVQPSEVGRLRLRVEPATAQVYVDGFYMGTVDDFNGSGQDVSLEAGPHRIEIRAPGYETLTFDVKTDPSRTITYRGALRPVRQ
jgi:PEGA domain-containing protein